ncbi:MAG: hypothetical protein JF606_26670 [Burkholderiales bacterium]|jgi:hypothetical protein|nr:hypothetical protein [Burkholderiales bacterium]
MSENVKVMAMNQRDPDNTKEDLRRWHRSRRLAMWIGIVLTTLVVLAGAAVLALQSPGAWLGAAGWIAAVKPVIVLVHLAVIATLWWNWTRVVDWLYRRGRIAAASVLPCLAMRNQLLVWVLLIELLTVIRPWEWFL